METNISWCKKIKERARKWRILPLLSWSMLSDLCLDVKIDK